MRLGIEERTWRWWHIAGLWIGMAICIPAYLLASELIDQGWTWQAAVGAVILGSFLVLGPIALMSHAGTKYGIPFPVLARASFGVRGAAIPALLRSLVACGWFGIQTWIGGWAIYKLIEVIWPGIATLPRVLPVFVGLNTGEFLCFLVFCALTIRVVLRGMSTIKFLASWGAPFLLLIGAVMLGWAVVRVGGLGPMLQNTGGQTLANGRGVAGAFGIGLASAVAFWGTLALSIPDFSRYAHSQRDQVIGQAVGLPGTMALFAFISAAVTNATVIIFHQRIADPITLLARLGGPVMIGLAMAGLTIATLTTNIVANVVAPANGFLSLAPDRITFKQATLITAGLGILMMPWRLYHDTAAYVLTWLIGTGALLAPVAGITIADYLMRRGAVAVDDLYRRDGAYEYKDGFNWIAIGALVVGVAPSLPGFVAALGGTPATGLFGTLYSWAWFVGFFLAAIVYVIGTRTRARAGSRVPGAVSVGA